MTRSLLLLVCAAGSLAAQPRWTLSPRPSLDLGDERKIETQFDGVVGVLRMPGGELVVANGVSQELRVFSPNGDYLRTLASSDGPVELRALDRAWRGGDTIFVAELLRAESNVHMFTVARYIGKHQVGSINAGGITPLARFPDGRFLITATARPGDGAGTGSRGAPTPSPLARPLRDSIPLGVLSPDHPARPTWITSLRRNTVLVRPFGRGNGGAAQSPSYAPYAFAPAEVYAVSGDRLWIGDTETGRVRQFSAVGKAFPEFTVPIPQRPLDTLLLRRERLAVLNDAMNWYDRARVDASYLPPLPASAPRFRALVPGVNGEMWLEHFQEAAGAPRSYLVVDRAGKAIGQVQLPARVLPLEIGTDYLLGVRRDDDGLEHIVQFALHRQPAR